MKNKEKGVSKGVKLRTIDEYMSANRVIYGEHKSSDSWSDGIVNSWYDDIIRRRKQPTKFEEMVDEHFWKTNAIACVLSWQYTYRCKNGHLSFSFNA